METRRSTGSLTHRGQEEAPVEGAASGSTSPVGLAVLSDGWEPRGVGNTNEHREPAETSGTLS